MITTPEFKVGALVVIVAGLIGIMSLKVSEGPGVFSGSKRYWFDVEDASGLVKRSAVRTAGIDVGIIENIKLVNGKARIYLLVNGDVPLKTSGMVEIRASGILGDKYVELIPGIIDDSELESGAQIMTARQRGSLDQLMQEIGKITETLSSLARTLDGATSGNGDNSNPIGRIILNVEKLTQDLAEVSGENKDKVHEIVERVNNITRSLEGFLADEGSEGFAAGWQKAVNSLSRIDSSLRNIEEITDKINTGEGTLGRLVNDEETVEKINTAVDNVNDFLGGVDRMETSLDYHSELLSEESLTKSYLNIRIQPGLDRYYEIGIIDDPRGVVDTTRTVTSGSSTGDITEVRTYQNKLKFSALFAKNFYDFTIKGGIIENTGGFAFDYYLLNRRLKFSLEAFNFDDLHVKSYVKYDVMKGLYVIGGGDELADKNLKSAFFGVGLFITNDDLKTLASKVSF